MPPVMAAAQESARLAEREDQTGPVIGALSQAGEFTLTAVDREALEQGRLYLEVATTSQPRGARAPLRLH